MSEGGETGEWMHCSRTGSVYKWTELLSVSVLCTVMPLWGSHTHTPTHPHAHLYVCGVASLSGNLNLYECKSRQDGVLFSRPCSQGVWKQLPPCKALQGWASYANIKTRKWGDSKSFILFHMGQISSCAAQICKAKGVHPRLCLCQGV